MHADGFATRDISMKHPVDVLRMKEREILKVKGEIEALRISVKLLSDEPIAESRRQETPRQEAPLDFNALESALDSIDGL